MKNAAQAVSAAQGQNSQIFLHAQAKGLAVFSTRLLNTSATPYPHRES
jgi:hypothetical protein